MVTPTPPLMSTFTLTPGNALSCYINTHRSGWDGTICSDPTGWNCAATDEFRRDYCARGTARCYHIHAFDAAAPWLVMDDYGAGWVLGENPHRLDDQILVILAREGIEPGGIREDARRRYKIAGAYRVREARKIEQGHRVLWRVQPYEDGWTRFHRLGVDSPRFEHAGGPYIKQIDREMVLRVFHEADEAANRHEPGWTDAAELERFRHFRSRLTEWLDQAARAVARSPVRSTWRAMAARSLRAVGETGAGPLGDLPSTGPDADPGDGASKPTRLAQRGDDDPLIGRPPMLESARIAWVRENHGEAICKDLQVASLTKDILLLSGSTGVGKSYLAQRLLDDPERERTLVLPVSAGWRSSADLLRHPNFVAFLRRAETAWRAGDGRARIVVFEEFNLSQPEHWFADVLVATQSRLERDRVLLLPDAAIAKETAVPRGPESPVEDPLAVRRLFVSPGLRFVATINQDHTVCELSPRILDRAAFVELRVEPRQALARVGLRILEEMTMAIADLDYLVRPKGASFSIRSALSLRACLEELESLGLSEWDAVDIVLVQEVLSKVRLTSRESIDEAVLTDLKHWQDRHGNRLIRCSGVIQEWEELLRSDGEALQD